MRLHLTDGPSQLLPLQGLINAQDILWLCRLDAMGSCQADLLLLTEHVEEGCLKELLPLNSLRNIAILATRTPLIFIADGESVGACALFSLVFMLYIVDSVAAGDFLVSKSLSVQLSSPQAFQQVLLLASSRSFIVIPAFEINTTAFTPHPERKRSTLASALQAGTQAAQDVAAGCKMQLQYAELGGWVGPFGYTRSTTTRCRVGHCNTNYSR